MSEEKQYQFDNYVIGYDKGFKDRSCLIIGEKRGDNFYIINSLYDETANILNKILDGYKKEIERLNEELEVYKDANKYHQNTIKELETVLRKTSANILHSENVKLSADNNKLNNKLQEVKKEIEKNVIVFEDSHLTVRLNIDKMVELLGGNKNDRCNE